MSADFATRAEGRQGHERRAEERGHRTSYRAKNSSRGFAMRDLEPVDDGRFMIFWNADTSHCAIMHSRGGSVAAAETVSNDARME